MLTSIQTFLLSGDPLILLVIGFAVLFIGAWIFTLRKTRHQATHQKFDAEIAVETADNSFMSTVVLPITVHYTSPHQAAHHPEQIQNYVLNHARQLAARATLADLYDRRMELEAQLQKKVSERFAEDGYFFSSVAIRDPKPGDEVRIAFQQAAQSYQQETDSMAAVVKRQQASLKLRIRAEQLQAKLAKEAGVKRKTAV